MAQEVIKVGIQMCAPTALDIALEGNVHAVKTK